MKDTIEKKETDIEKNDNTHNISFVPFCLPLFLALLLGILSKKKGGGKGFAMRCFEPSFFQVIRSFLFTALVCFLLFFGDKILGVV